MQLSDAQIDRYSRQIILPEIGGRGQQRLLGSGVGLVGGGAVAAIAARYLAAAGIGRIDWFGADHESAHIADTQRELTALNPETTVVVRARDRMRDADPVTGNGIVIVSGGSVDALTRINRSALQWRAVLLAGAAGAHGGWVALYAGHLPALPCADCEVPPEVDMTETVETPAAGVIGSLLALEAVKVFLGLPSGLQGRSLHFDADTSTMTDHPVTKRETCRVCAQPLVAGA